MLWSLTWIPGQILLLSGPPGLGKTTLAYVLAHQAGYQVLEVNASDERTGKVVDDRIKPALESRALSMNGSMAGNKPTCIVIDEIDGAAGGGEAVSHLASMPDPFLLTRRHSGVRPLAHQAHHRRQFREMEYRCELSFRRSMTTRLIRFCRRENEEEGREPASAPSHHLHLQRPVRPVSLQAVLQNPFFFLTGFFL